MADVAAIVLAAGRASRYRAAGGPEPTKLIADYRGEPLARWAARAALASRARPVVVVTGHAQAEVEAALAGLDLRFAHNPDYAEGLATSLRAGVAALPADSVGALILLGDMPEASAATADALIAAFEAMPGALAAVAVYQGRRGNPVLLGSGLFGEVARLSGDEGARGLLLGLPPERIASVEVTEAGVRKDVDTPADLEDSFTVRQATELDRADIVAAIVELQDFERTLSDAQRPGSEVAAPYYEKISARARDNGGAMLVAEAGGAFVGFVVGWIENQDEVCETEDSNRFGYVSDICVRRSFRGRRAANVLLRALEERLARHGVTRLRISFLSNNVLARAAYERAGFAPYESIYEKRIISPPL
jgi:molybdenum cofactor cytidylyltransferase